MNSSLTALTAYASTRDVLAHLIETYLERGPAFAQDRLVLEGWADEWATGTGAAHQVVLMEPERSMAMNAFFSNLSREQAGRFLSELFADIIPHLATQRTFFGDIEAGKTPTGAAVERAPLLEHLAGVLGGFSEHELETVATTQVKRLVWVDDQERTIHSRAEVQVSMPIAPPARRRGLFS